MQEERRPGPWYTVPWVWLLIALPLTAVIGGMVTIYLAVSTSDGLVDDDYYRRGKAINMDLARDQAALEHGLQARLAFGPQAAHVDIQLSAARMRMPDSIELVLMHPTRGGMDSRHRLEHAGAGRYQGEIGALAAGRWYVRLAAEDWRLTGTLHVPVSGPVVLAPLNRN